MTGLDRIKKPQPKPFCRRNNRKLEGNLLSCPSCHPVELFVFPCLSLTLSARPAHRLAVDWLAGPRPAGVEHVMLRPIPDMGLASQAALIFLESTPEEPRVHHAPLARLALVRRAHEQRHRPRRPRGPKRQPPAGRHTPERGTHRATRGPRRRLASRR